MNTLLAESVQRKGGIYRVDSAFTMINTQLDPDQDHSLLSQGDKTESLEIYLEQQNSTVIRDGSSSIWNSVAGVW